MKKKFLSVLGVVAMMALVAYASQVNSEEAELSDMPLENAEALAQNINPDCPNGCLTDLGSCKCHGPQPYLEATWSDDNVLLPSNP